MSNAYNQSYQKWGFLPWLRVYSEYSYQNIPIDRKLRRGKATRRVLRGWRIALKGEREDTRLLNTKE